jgi:hypothetical protein
MSTLSATTINTANGTTDLTITTGNTTTGGLVIYANGYGMMLKANSSSNTFFISSTGSFVFGSNTGTVTAITGLSNTSYGVLGQSNSNYGVFGNSNQSYGVAGNSNSSIGVSASTNTGTAISARSNTGIVATFSNATATLMTVNQSNVQITSNTLTLGTSSIAANGYSRLPNGLLLQWGTQSASVNSTTVATATFATTFTTLYSISLSGIEGSATTTFKAFANSTSTSGITWKNDATTAAASFTINYMAIGV